MVLGRPGVEVSAATALGEGYPKANLVKPFKGVVHGVRVEEAEEPLMREIRYLDKLIDEIARDEAMK
jgi:hypothetical protein